MSECSGDYCPKCKQVTAHEDGCCILCIEAQRDRAREIENNLFDSDIEHYGRCIGRFKETTWKVIVFSGVNEEAMYPFFMDMPDGNQFHVAMIAPYAGNEAILNTQDDAYELWDEARLNSL